MQGSRGKVKPLPEFAQRAAASEGGAAPTEGCYLVAWDVQAEDGIGPVLLLARAAHCLQQLHVANVARQAVATTEYWQVSTEEWKGTTLSRARPACCMAYLPQLL